MADKDHSTNLRIRLSLKVNYSLMVIFCSCVCLWVQFYALPYKKASMFSLANRSLLVIWIIVVGVLLFRRMLKPISGEAVNVVMIIAFTVISWIFATVRSPGNTIDNALKMAGFLLLPLMLCYSLFYRIDPRAKSIVLITFLFIALLFIRLFHSDLCHEYQGPYGIVLLDAATLGYANPNQTAMYTFLCSMGLIIGSFYFERKFVKFLFGTVGCYTAWIMFCTESRTTALLFVVFVAMAIYVSKREVPELWIHGAYLLPVAYLLLSAVLPLLGETFTFMGEGIFTGREQIYDRYFQRWSILTFVFGDMNYFQFDNLHNGYIAVAASAGVIVCLSYIMLLRSFLLRNRPGSNAPVYERIAFVGVLCAVMNMSSEAALLVGGSQYAFLLFCLITLFANPCAKSEK